MNLYIWHHDDPTDGNYGTDKLMFSLGKDVKEAREVFKKEFRDDRKVMKTLQKKPKVFSKPKAYWVDIPWPGRD